MHNSGGGKEGLGGQELAVCYILNYFCTNLTSLVD
jgi:hypothetical protein